MNCLTRNGFTLEGTLRQARMHGGRRWDILVFSALEPEVRDWEPRGAVVGEGTTERVASEARSVLRAGGALVLETAGGRAETIADMLRGLGYIE